MQIRERFDLCDHKTCHEKGSHIVMYRISNFMKHLRECLRHRFSLDKIDINEKFYNVIVNYERSLLYYVFHVV